MSSITSRVNTTTSLEFVNKQILTSYLRTVFKRNKRPVFSQVRCTHDVADVRQMNQSREAACREELCSALHFYCELQQCVLMEPPFWDATEIRIYLYLCIIIVYDSRKVTWEKHVLL
jgi:hypothetical protein